MKSLLAFVLLVACATQAYSACVRPSCGCSRPGYVYNNYYEYPSHVEPCCPNHVCRHEPVHCVPPCPTKSSELYPCPYRQHGPCL